jgi:hypothetical protein
MADNFTTCMRLFFLSPVLIRINTVWLCIAFTPLLVARYTMVPENFAQSLPSWHRAA